MNKHIRELLLFCLIAYATLCRALDTSKKYYIFHSSGMVLSAADATPNLHTFQSADDQIFQFVQSGSYVLVKSQKSGKNIGKTGEWDTEYTTSTSTSAQFSVEETGVDLVRLKCANNNLYLGTDGIAPGSTVYSDKTGNEPNHYWFVREASALVVINDGLKGAIEKAEQQLANTKAGETEGTYSATSRELLRRQIDEAQELLNSNSQEEINKATANLQTATNTYKNSRNNAFVVGEKYYLVHAGNRLLTNSDNKIQLKEATYGTNQQFSIEQLSDGTYSLKNVQDGGYLSALGEYSTTLSGNTNAQNSHLKIAYAPNEDHFVRIQFTSNGLYLGTDGTSDGSGVYSDKSGNDGKHYWQLLRVGNEQQPYTTFRNGSSATRLGENWLDESGHHINAHGGCVLYKDGIYYWFGENYRRTPVKSNGIVCYTSKDLYNWKYECMAYECPNVPLRDDNQDMNYGRTLERPKVIYNPNTQQYVMWVHWENGSGYAASRVALLYSNSITGPYTFVRTTRPRGNEQPSGSRDQTLLYDPEFGVAYHFGSAEENMTMHATLLTNDYLDLSSQWARIFVKKQYEAPAVIKYHGRFMAVTSGCTGWDPNAAHASYSELPFDGWNDLGNPCMDANANKTYNSQSNYIFQVPNLYNAYIYMGDRWKGGDYFTDANVGESWHIWLPIDMRTGYPILRFYREWSLDLFNQLNRYRRVAKVESGKEYVLLSRNANRVLSDKKGKLQLTEDNDEQNISFRVWENGKYYSLVDTRKGTSLTLNGQQLAWEDSTGNDEQLWALSSAGNDGYYYLSPKTNSNVMLTNLCATPTSNGFVGITNSSNSLSNRFAFCFDSKKHNYTPISNEADGSYTKWMESLGYEHTHVPEDWSQDKTPHQLTVGCGKREIDIKSWEKQDVYIYNTQGLLIKKLQMEAGETHHLPLPAGIYIVNHIKAVVF